MKIVNTAVRERAIERCRERGVVIPTFAQQRDPSTVDPAVIQALADVDMQTPDPLNLFRITWRNDPGSAGFGAVNALEIPSEISGVPARIGDSCPANSTPRRTGRSGLPPATTAAEECSTAHFSDVRPLRFSPRK